MGRLALELFEAPVAVIEVYERPQRIPEVVQGLLDPALQHLLLEGAPEALDHAVGLGLADIGEALADPEVRQLRLEVLGGVLAAVVVPQGQARPDALDQAAEVLPQSLLHGLHRLERVAHLHGLRQGGIRALEFVKLLGSDGAVVDLGVVLGGTLGREQGVLPH